MSALLGSLIIADDVLLLRVEDLSADVRAQLGPVGAGELAVGRAKSRQRPILLGADAAALLVCFREPRTVAEAILAFCDGRAATPEQVFEQALPILVRLNEAKILVSDAARFDRRTAGGLPAGTDVGGFEIMRAIQLLDDSEVYLARRGADRAVIKLAALPGDARMRRKLDSERAILERLGGEVGPALLSSGEHLDRPFLALEWLGGEDALTLSNRLRRAGGEAALLAMTAKIARAYAALHARGVAHGDVHPMNVLVAADGSVRLIDFGSARFIDRAPRGFVEPEREGVPYFFEPEAARAFLARQRAPAANPAGELYGVAALAHLLLTGHHTFDFSLEHAELLRQIAHVERPRWADRPRLRARPQIEAILARALAKKPKERSDLGALAAALEALIPPKRAHAPVAQTSAFVRSDLLRRLAGQPSALDAAMAEPPTASVMFGAAGAAYALSRAAMLEESAGLLAAADVWCARAVAAPAATAHHRRDWGIETFAPISLFHGRPGVELVRASIAHLRWDVPALRVALAAFVEASRDRDDGLRDLTTGRSGTLLGCALLAETIPDDPLIDRGALLALGEGVAQTEWRALEALPPIGDPAGIVALGLAHGWAGMLFSQLRWLEARHRRPPAGLDRRIEQLLALAPSSGGGLALPRAVGRDVASDPLRASWCNGAAGMVPLMLAAHRVYLDPALLDAAQRFGAFARDSEPMLGSLCCGSAGVGFAMLSLFRATGQRSWRAAAENALSQARAGRYPQSMPHSLYKGEIGAALLAVEIERAEDSAFPMIEPTSA